MTGCLPLYPCPPRKSENLAHLVTFYKEDGFVFLPELVFFVTAMRNRAITEALVFTPTDFVFYRLCLMFAKY